MSYVEKGRRRAYDNIAVGSQITTRERVLPDASGAKAGTTPPTANQAVGNTEKIAVGVSYGEERVVAGSALMEGERLG